MRATYKIIKNSSHGKRCQRDIEKGEKWKTETIRKVYQRNNDNKILYFYFLFMEKDIFSVAGYLKRKWNTKFDMDRSASVL